MVLRSENEFGQIFAQGPMLKGGRSDIPPACIAKGPLKARTYTQLEPAVCWSSNQTSYLCDSGAVKIRSSSVKRRGPMNSSKNHEGERQDSREWVDPWGEPLA
jgi:hypothetical protein